MGRLRWHGLVLAALGGAVAAPAALLAQTTMIGIVRDDSTGRPLPGVEVLLSGTAHTTVTNAAGRYLLAGLPPGNHQAIFRMVGYLPARVTVLLSAGDTLRVNQVMVPSTVVLDPIQVVGEDMVGLAGRGFHERMKMGFGRFYEPAELRELEHVKVSDLLRRKGGVEISQVGFNGIMVAMNPSSRDVNGKLNCLMSVFLDGRLITRGTRLDLEDTNFRWETHATDLRGFVNVSDLEAVEVYRSAAGIPVEFGGAIGQCGAVILWTRRAP